MKALTCNNCGRAPTVHTEYCNWCGHGPYERGGIHEEKCSDCKGPVANSFCYCPWCAIEFEEGAERVPQKVCGFRLSDKCGCGGGVSSAMKFCPWCGDDLGDQYKDECRCGECYHPVEEEWLHCGHCGEWLQGEVYPLAKGKKLSISPRALQFLCMSAVDRLQEFEEGFFEDSDGKETFGILFGRGGRNEIRLSMAFPLASATADEGSVEPNAQSFRYLMRHVDTICKDLAATEVPVGFFHSHPHCSSPFPSTADRESTNEGILELIVACETTTKKERVRWDKERKVLTLATGGVRYHIAAFQLTDGVLEIVPIRVR